VGVAPSSPGFCAIATRPVGYLQEAGQRYCNDSKLYDNALRRNHRYRFSLIYVQIAQIGVVSVKLLDKPFFVLYKCFGKQFFFFTIFSFSRLFYEQYITYKEAL